MLKHLAVQCAVFYYAALIYTSYKTRSTLPLPTHPLQRACVITYQHARYAPSYAINAPTHVAMHLHVSFSFLSFSFFLLGKPHIITLTPIHAYTSRYDIFLLFYIPDTCMLLTV